VGSGEKREAVDEQPLVRGGMAQRPGTSTRYEDAVVVGDGFLFIFVPFTLGGLRLDAKRVVLP
jgi:hypothetical protein